MGGLEGRGMFKAYLEVELIGKVELSIDYKRVFNYTLALRLIFRKVWCGTCSIQNIQG